MDPNNYYWLSYFEIIQFKIDPDRDFIQGDFEPDMGLHYWIRRGSGTETICRLKGCYFGQDK